ncbi:MAG: ABC transporter ATP-binding protein [Planctomycetota bacterium]
MTSPFLAARALVFDYPGPLRALDGVDLELRPGDLTAVLGPNGSGKSTLLKVLGGLLEPSSGQVLLQGVAPRSLTPRERAKKIATVPQFLPALPDFSVRDFVSSGRYARVARFQSATASDRDAVTRALADCDAADLEERPMAELSGGQRQRVLVARALAQDAPVLLIDEPTAGLDPEHQIRVLDLVASLRGERAALFVTHDLNLAGQYARHMILLDRGRVAAEGSVEEVLRPEVLAPVYGEHLHYGRWPSGDSAGRPFVLPRRAESASARG